MGRLIISLCCIFFVSGSAVAADLPQWETDNNCVALAGGAENKDQAVYEACITEEKRSKEILEKEYSKLPSDITTHCEKEASLVTPSYSVLRACIDEKAN